ncbi:MAG: molybdopterin-guanine dinucleotide biosynthesis protein B, partial [Myxococcota bacterium]
SIKTGDGIFAADPGPGIIHIVGMSGHGKTTLMADLIKKLKELGIRAGTIKHSAHSHELDIEGKDSHTHRMAGANPAAVISRDLSAVFIENSSATDRYAQIMPMFSHCDLVLIEGDKSATGIKLEVWRAEKGGRPLAETPDPGILAVITDDPVAPGIVSWKRSDVGALAAGIRKLILA